MENPDTPELQGAAGVPARLFWRGSSLRRFKPDVWVTCRYPESVPHQDSPTAKKLQATVLFKNSLVFQLHATQLELP